MIATIAEKTAIAKKKKEKVLSQQSLIATVTGKWFPYNRYHRCDR